MLMMKISAFGQFKLWGPSLGVRVVLPSTAHDDDADNKPVWPTWAVGALFRGARCIHINRVMLSHNFPVIEESLSTVDRPLGFPSLPIVSTPRSTYDDGDEYKPVWPQGYARSWDPTSQLKKHIRVKG
jgi:hypothetical protein